MILENFKKIFFKPAELLRILMALIFLAAGFFRIFNPGVAELELVYLDLPIFFTWFILIIEIGFGILLLIGRKVKLAATVLILFLVFALVNALKINGVRIIHSLSELFVFNANPTDFFLHLIFLILLLIVLINRKK